MVTQEKRNATLSSKMRQYTTANTVSQQKAQAALVREGFYLKNGKVAPQFADRPDKARA